MTATTEMVERVARALCWSNGMEPDKSLGGDGENFLWMEYVPQASAAIAAMREPTEAMLDVTSVVEARRAKAGYREREHWAWGWRIMNDAALEPTKDAITAAKEAT